MPRPRKSIPSYLPHKRSGRARAVWTDSTGTRRFRLLPGLYDSPESRAAFARLLLELDTAPQLVRTPDPAGVTVNEVLLAYLGHAERHYRGPDGVPTDEVRHLRTACRHVRELYGTTPAADFGPLALKAVRQRFVAAGWSRKTVNARVERIRRVFRWAVAEEPVPPSVHQALAAVAGLQRGRTPARETDPVPPAMSPGWGGMVTDHRGNVERWVGFVLYMLKEYEPEAVENRARGRRTRPGEIRGAGHATRTQVARADHPGAAPRTRRGVRTRGGAGERGRPRRTARPVPLRGRQPDRPDRTRRRGERPAFHERVRGPGVGRSAKGRKGTSMGRVKATLARAEQGWVDERAVQR